MQESLGLANGVATQAIGYLRGLRGLGQDQALLPKFADAVATVKEMLFRLHTCCFDDVGCSSKSYAYLFVATAFFNLYGV